MKTALWNLPMIIAGYQQWVYQAQNITHLTNCHGINNPELREKPYPYINLHITMEAVKGQMTILLSPT